MEKEILKGTVTTNTIYVYGGGEIDYLDVENDQDSLKSVLRKFAGTDVKITIEPLLNNEEMEEE